MTRRIPVALRHAVVALGLCGVAAAGVTTVAVTRTGARPTAASMPVLSVDGGGVFLGALLSPDHPQQQCLRVRLTGGPDQGAGAMVLGVQQVGGALADDLHMTVERVNLGNGTAACGSVAGTSLFSGSLAQLGTLSAGASGGLSSNLAVSGGAGWIDYRLTAQLASSAAPGSQGSGEFTWTSTIDAVPAVGVVGNSPAPETSGPGPTSTGVPGPTSTSVAGTPTVSSQPSVTPTPELPTVPTVPNVPIGTAVPGAATPSAARTPAAGTEPAVPRAAVATTARTQRSPGAATSAPVSAPTSAPSGRSTSAGTSPVRSAGSAEVPVTGSTSSNPSTGAVASLSPGGPASARPSAAKGRPSLWHQVSEFTSLRIERLVQALPPTVRSTAREAAAKSRFPLLLLLAVLVFLLVQDRIDRRDPKLALAPLRPDEPVFFPGARQASTVRPTAAGDAMSLPDTTAPGAGRASRRTGTAGLVSRWERLRWLVAVRAVVVAGPLLAWVFAPGNRTGQWRDLWVPAAIVAATIPVLFVLGRADRRVVVTVLGATLLLDGVYLAWALRCLDGLSGPVSAVVLFDALALTLLASFRTGLKLTVWYVLTGLVAIAGDRGGLFGPTVLHVTNQQVLMASLALGVLTLTTALFAAANERELRRRRYESEVLRRFANDLDHCGGVRAAAGTLADLAVEHLGGQRVLVVVGAADVCGTEAPGPLAEGTVVRRNVVDVLRWRQDVRDDPSLVEAVGRPESTLLAQLAPGDAWLRRLLPDARNVLLVPLGHSDGVHGILVVERGEGRRRGGTARRARVDRRILVLAEQAAAHTGQAVGRLQLVAQLRSAATTDGLTGLLNRRTLDTVLAERCRQAEQDGSALSVLMIDLDHFKALNDTHGHQAGDDALRAVGALLQETLRDGSIAARYGGEEFCVVVRAELGDAVRLAERIRRDIANLTGLARPLTTSIGVASYPSSGGHPHATVAAADQALYAAKERGRNRVESAAVAQQVVPSGD